MGNCYNEMKRNKDKALSNPFINSTHLSSRQMLAHSKNEVDDHALLRSNCLRFNGPFALPHKNEISLEDNIDLIIEHIM